MRNRKMGFVVDKVSEDSFYENLLLGLSKILEKSPCVSNMNLKRLPGVRQVDIRSWEHTNGVILPEDIRAFYSSTNGFYYSYDFSYDYQAACEDERYFRKSKIAINGISDLVRVFGYDTKNTGQIDQYGKKYKLTLSRESKVFEMSTVDDYAKIVLVYVSSYSLPTIWLCVGQTNFEYLSEDFTTYLRMCLAHLGIPCWQYVVTSEGIPEWSREMFNLIAPGVLAEDRNLVEIPKLNMDYVNKIDPNIFSTPHSGTALNLDRNSGNLKGFEARKNEKKGGKIVGLKRTGANSAKSRNINSNKAFTGLL